MKLLFSYNWSGDWMPLSRCSKPITPFSCYAWNILLLVHRSERCVITVQYFSFTYIQSGTAEWCSLYTSFLLDGTEHHLHYLPVDRSWWSLVRISAGSPDQLSYYTQLWTTEGSTSSCCCTEPLSPGSAAVMFIGWPRLHDSRISASLHRTLWQCHPYRPGVKESRDKRWRALVFNLVWNPQ